MMGWTEVSDLLSQTWFEAECQAKHQHFTAQHNQKSLYQLIQLIAIASVDVVFFITA